MQKILLVWLYFIRKYWVYSASMYTALECGFSQLLPLIVGFPIDYDPTDCSLALSSIFHASFSHGQEISQAQMTESCHNDYWSTTTIFFYNLVNPSLTKTTDAWGTSCNFTLNLEFSWLCCCKFFTLKPFFFWVINKWKPFIVGIWF